MSIYEPASPDVTKWREDAETATYETQPSPERELISDMLYMLGFVCFVAVICAIAGVVWGVLQQFYPSTHCMILQSFSINCK